MKAFVTGLCLQGNKGGPALVFSLLQTLRGVWPDLEFVLSVPGEKEFPHERIAAQKYGIEVVEGSSGFDLISTSPDPARFKRWFGALRRCDFVLEMSAISYVGPPAAVPSFRQLCFSGRFFNFVASVLARRPLVAWTQSYGPFSTRWLRIAGRLDLRRQPVVLCRGDDCAEAVRTLIPGKTTLSFPDVAVVLERKSCGWTARRDAGAAPLATVSPSAVLYGKSRGSGTGNAHVRQIAGLVGFLRARGFDVWLVPHTFRPGRHDPSICDFAVCELVREACGAELTVVDEDLSPQELKGIIGTAYLHLGARYHSVVAALSTGVPCIALSWHAKYKDIMRFYGMGRFVCESIETEDDVELQRMIEALCSAHAELARLLQHKQADAVRLIAENAGAFVGNYKRIAGP